MGDKNKNECSASQRAQSFGVTRKLIKWPSKPTCEQLDQWLLFVSDQVVYQQRAYEREIQLRDADIADLRSRLKLLESRIDVLHSVAVDQQTASKNEAKGALVDGDCKNANIKKKQNNNRWARKKAAKQEAAAAAKATQSQLVTTRPAQMQPSGQINGKQQHVNDQRTEGRMTPTSHKAFNMKETNVRMQMKITKYDALKA